MHVALTKGEIVTTALWSPYLRYSPRRNAAQCESCETQLAMLTGYFGALGRPMDRVFREPDISGVMMDNRPILQEAIKHVCETKGVLAVYNLSRMARSTLDSLKILSKLHDAGADLFSLKEQIDTTSSIGRFFFTIVAAFAALEREQISERTIDAMWRHQYQGGRRMTHPDKIPFGWRADPRDSKRIVMDDDEQELLVLIKRLADDGLSPRKICKILDDHKIPRRGKSWAKGYMVVDRLIKRLRNGNGHA